MMCGQIDLMVTPGMIECGKGRGRHRRGRKGTGEEM